MLCEKACSLLFNFVFGKLKRKKSFFHDINYRVVTFKEILPKGVVFQKV